MKRILCVGIAMIMTSCAPAQQYEQSKTLSGAAAKMDSIKNDDILLREFLQAMPKGGDIHNHLFGAVYAESILRYAEEDGMCIDKAALAVTYPGANGCGNLPDAKTALAGNQALRNQMIDNLSLRDYVPERGWSGHDQFFNTFALMPSMPFRFADMTAEVANNAARQNISYLELMHTMELFETILPMVGGMKLSGDPAVDYKLLMESEFGEKLPELVARAKRDMETAMTRKNEILRCGTKAAEPGCNVTIRFQNQSVRTLPPSAVYAHMIFGWELIKESEWFVGTNLVAPEDDFIALANYDAHMAQLGYLYDTQGARNISLHAGELWLGLVHPKELRSHINKAVNVARAKRIGHGTDIVFEDGYQGLLKQMRDENILVEINITSSDAILGVRGDDHPFHIYKAAGVPMALSTDDEGVARIDLTNEYVRAVEDFGVGYDDLKGLARNSIAYSFLDEATKATLLDDLDTRFAEFESRY